MGSFRQTVRDDVRIFRIFSSSSVIQRFLSTITLCCVCLCVAGQGSLSAEQSSQHRVDETQGFFRTPAKSGISDSEQIPAKFMLMKIMLARASNDVDNDVNVPKSPTGASRAGMSRIDEVGRFFRGGAPMGTDYLNRYFLYRYDMGDRWTMARVETPHAVVGSTKPPSATVTSPFATTVTSSFATTVASTVSSNQGTVGGRDTSLPFFSMTSVGPFKSSGTTKTFTTLPDVPTTLSTKRCWELPQRFALVACRNETVV